MCHSLASIPQPVCREEIVVKDEMPMQTCLRSQAAIADWKAHSIYSGEQWAIGRIKCVPGDYVIKGAAGYQSTHVHCRGMNRPSPGATRGPLMTPGADITDLFQYRNPSRYNGHGLREGRA